MATNVTDQGQETVAEMQSLLTDLAGALEAEHQVQRHLIEQLRGAEAEGERQRRVLNG